MPGPLELLLDPASLVIFALYGGILLWEALAPARRLPRVRWWRLKGLAAFFTFFFVSTYLPMLWDEHLARWRLLDLTHLGPVAGTLVGLLVYELGLWLWHSRMHRNDKLWRAFHQMHHSAERLDAYGAFYFSPLDMIGWSALGSVALVLVVGLSAQATTMVVVLTTWLGIFQHANVRTPRWLGYIVQRPESHTVHHARGIHAFNYSDLPIFDLLFGTFENPRTFEHETGFYEGASGRVVDMLLARDVSRPPRPAAAPGGYVGACGPRRTGELGARS
jgi:sterol desaturase/sphingolipid hydroxylase (fatty acid hydroxylase superfamily)